MDDLQDLEERLVALQTKHQDLDSAIEALRRSPALDMFAMKRLQKEKLALKDQIEKIRSELIPDIIA